MSELIIIAGPQAAGKTTVIAHLGRTFASAAALFKSRDVPALFPLQESRQVMVHKNMLLGAIFMSAADEKEVVQCDFRRMNKMLELNDKRIVYLDECNIFTIAHAWSHGVGEIEAYWDAYIDYLTKLQAKVIFIDIPPNISWERRYERYRQRLVYFPEPEHTDILSRYKQYLARVYPRLRGIYEQLPLPKILIDGRISEKAVCEEVTRQLAALSSYF